MTSDTSSVEVEWQFDAPDLEAVDRWLQTQPAHGALTFVPQPERTQRDEYFDTADWRLHRARFTLRVRAGPASAEATMKAFGELEGGLRRRLEVNQALSAGAADLRDLEGAVSARLRLLIGARPLRSLFVVQTRRRTILVQSAGVTLATIALDHATVEDHPERPIRRVEVEESLPGAMRDVERFLDALRAATGLQLATGSKFEAGLEAAGLTPDADLDLGPLRIPDDAPAAEFAFAILRRDFSSLLRYEPGARLGEDIEQLHQMRVATRRLRAALSAFEPVLPPEFRQLRDELRWLAASLGAVRDLDVHLEALARIRRDSDWEDSNALAPLIDLVEESRRDARVLLLATLDSPQYDALVERMTAALRSGDPPAPASAEGGIGARDFARRLLRDRYRRFRRDADHLTPRSAPTEFHAVRIRGKRLRYSLDFTGQLVGRPAVRAERQLRRIQDLLGEHQDADLARSWYHDLARDGANRLPPDTLFLMGRLAEQQGVRMTQLRRRWPAHLDALKDSWRRLRRALEDEPTPSRHASSAAARPRLAPLVPQRPRYRALRLPRFPRRPAPPSEE
ncbi:MAG: CHAD domain-containing protein [Dehalococcoidia bacterium]